MAKQCGRERVGEGEGKGNVGRGRKSRAHGRGKKGAKEMAKVIKCRVLRVQNARV